jgi:hypothetical protein
MLQVVWRLLIKQNLFVFQMWYKSLVSYIRDNGAMNAVICTDGTLLKI